MRARFFLKATLATLLVVASATPCRAQRGGFSLLSSAFLDSTRAPVARITAEVPFTSLVFFKKFGVYDARYEVYVSIREAKTGRLQATYVLSGFASVQTYEETRKRDLRSRTYRVVGLPPGEYEIEGVLRVKQTLIAIRRTSALRVPDFLSTGMGFGTPVVTMVPQDRFRQFAALAEFQADSSTTSESVLDEALEMFDRNPVIRFDLFVDEPLTHPMPCTLYYEVVSPTDRQVLYGRRKIALTGRQDSWILGLDVDNWDPGAYRLNLRAAAGSGGRSATTSVTVNVDVTRAMLTTQFNETMEILGLLASRDELRGLRNADEADRPREWAKFWKARDPDRSTPENESLQEYIVRVQYVTQTYSGVLSGWRTDRGRVYIIHGPPDQISRTSDQQNRGEYEIWYYYARNRTFVFYDVFGVGDFKLVEGDLF